MTSNLRVQVYPVVHVETVDQVVAEVRRAVAHGVAGIFLIDHDADDRRLVNSIKAARDLDDALILGANVIRRTPARALAILAEAFPAGVPLQALWTDHSGVTAAGPDADFTEFTGMRADIGWHGLHFGGIAFKYQAVVPVEQLPALARVARQYVDVPTTSGPGTGQAADLTKLRVLREALGAHPLALASGVTPDNVSSLVGLVDHVLVSTGITTNGRLDEAALDRLLERVRR